MSVQIDEALKQWATKRQCEVIDAYLEHGTTRKAAKALGVHPSAVGYAIQAVKRKAAISGHSPEHDMTRTVPEPFKVRGVSTYYNREGKPTGQWVKSALDEQKYQAALVDWVEWLARDAEGRAPLIQAPPHSDNDIMCVYPLGDPHFGMYSWKEETGNDFDLDIAERDTCAAVDFLVDRAPPAKKALLLNVGDFFHADDYKNQTPGSGHTLDVDTRLAKVVQVGLRAFVHCVLRLLEKHEEVVVESLPGNHDPSSSFMLALCLAQYFRNEPRVRVVLSPAVYRYHRFGKNLIGVTHGDRAKKKDLPLLMATDMPGDWGETEFRYWYCGHVHHDVREEFPGVMVEYIRTLAGSDAWHAASGYRSGRDMKCIVLHREFGEVMRNTCNLSRLVCRDE